MNWWRGLVAMGRGLWQFRYPGMVRWLGSTREEVLLREEILRENPGAKVEYGVVVAGWRPGRLVMGDGATLCRGTVVTCHGEGPGAEGGRVRIGKGSWIGHYNNLRTSPESEIEIGDHCLISQFCSLVGANHKIGKEGLIQSQGMDGSRSGVKLGDDVWLGAGVTVLPGVTIGTGAVIGANSVVTEDVPPYEIRAGSPAVRKGQRS
ncbi:MAG TPA: acyltransferase [Kiritimatiellia bacterium]|nr:acyltransferase [Kiritimatiellia bacterium]